MEAASSKKRFPFLWLIMAPHVRSAPLSATTKRTLVRSIARPQSERLYNTQSAMQRNLRSLYPAWFCPTMCCLCLHLTFVATEVHHHCLFLYLNCSPNLNITCCVVCQQVSYVCHTWVACGCQQWIAYVAAVLQQVAKLPGRRLERQRPLRPPHKHREAPSDLAWTQLVAARVRTTWWLCCWAQLRLFCSGITAEHQKNVGVCRCMS